MIGEKYCPNCVCFAVCFSVRRVKDALDSKYFYLQHPKIPNLLRLIYKYLGYHCEHFHLTNGPLVNTVVER